MSKQQTEQNEELDLIRLAKEGDQQVFETLLERYDPLIGSMARKFSGFCGTEDLEDLRQEACILFHKALVSFDAEQTEVKFGLYAKKCILNGLISNQRKQKKYEQVVLLDDSEQLLLAEPPEDTDPAKRLTEEEAFLELSRRINEALSAYENRIWWLYLSGRTAKEVASLLGKDEKSVQNAIYRIRKKLRAVIPYS